MISNLNGSGSVRVHQKNAAFTGSRFRFGSTPWFYAIGQTDVSVVQLYINAVNIYNFLI